MRTTPASSNDTFSMLAAEVRRAPTERLATMTLYRAVDAWCAQQNRPPVQLLFLHVTNASSSSGRPRTYTIQTSSPRTVHAALCAILPECFEGTPVLHRMVGVDVHPAIKSDTPTWDWEENPMLFRLGTIASQLRSAPTFEQWWDTLFEGIPAYYMAHTGRTTWGHSLRTEWEKLRQSSSVYAAHTSAWATHQNEKSNLGLYVSTDAKERPPLSLAQTMLCASCPLLTVHDGHITNVAMHAHVNEIIRKGTQWADVYHTLHNTPISSTELSRLLRGGPSSPEITPISTELAWDS